MLLFIHLFVDRLPFSSDRCFCILFTSLLVLFGVWWISFYTYRKCTYNPILCRSMPCAVSRVLYSTWLDSYPVHVCGWFKLSYVLLVFCVLLIHFFGYFLYLQAVFDSNCFRLFYANRFIIRFSYPFVKLKSWIYEKFIRCVM